MQTRTISDSDRRLYMCAPSLCLAETITSLIETKTIADRHSARGRSSRGGRNERGSPRRGANGRRLSSFYCSQIEWRFSRGKSKEVEIGGPFSALDLPECIRLCRVVAVEARSLHAHTATKLSSRRRIRCPRTRRCAHPFLFTTRHPRKGTWGSAVYLHGDTQARVYVRAHALPQPSL